MRRRVYGPMLAVLALLLCVSPLRAEEAGSPEEPVPGAVEFEEVGRADDGDVREAEPVDAPPPAESPSDWQDLAGHDTWHQPTAAPAPANERPEYRLIDEQPRIRGSHEVELVESPRNWTVSAQFGAYRLSEIDDEFSGTGPAEQIFGKKRRFFFLLGAERFFWQDFGTVGLEAQIGYWQTYGKGLYRDGGGSSDTTVFNMIPMKLSAVYRFSAAWDKWGVPLVPFAKLGINYHIWWILEQGGDIASYTSPSGSSKSGYGGTFGFHVAYGLQFALDVLDKRLARNFDQEVGVNTTYLFFEGTYAKVNDFFAGSSFDLSDHYWMGGILFEF